MISDKFNVNNFQNLLILILIPSLITGPLLPEMICIILSLIFLFNLYRSFNLEFINKKIFLAYLLFTVLLVFGSILSKYTRLSIETSIFYFRFIIFALAFSLILGKDLKTLRLLFLISTITLVFLAVNIIIQYCFNIDLFGNIPLTSGRYSSLFGTELIAGGFLARFMFLGVIFILFISDINKKYNTYLLSFYLILNTCAIFLSGERTSFFILIINILIFVIYIKSFRKIIFILLICIPILGVIFIKINSDAKARMFEVTKSEIFENNKINIFTKVYQAHYTVAFNMFKDRPLIGHGVKSFREACKENRYDHYNGCTTHPHNFYMQFLAETGLFGFFFLILFYFYILFKFIKIFFKKERNKIDLIKLILYQAIIVNLFPFMPSGNFFNNWMSIVLYIPIALIIFFENLNNKNQKYLIKYFK
jgi:O-antigen ligase